MMSVVCNCACRAQSLTFGVRLCCSSLLLTFVRELLQTPSLNYPLFFEVVFDRIGKYFLPNCALPAPCPQNVLQASFCKLLLITMADFFKKMGSKFDALKKHKMNALANFNVPETPDEEFQVCIFAGVCVSVWQQQ